MNHIYLDYAATTPMDKEVLEKMLPYFMEQYENPSALYSQKVKYAIENARKQVAKTILAKPSEIIFTSGGTEANNLAIFGIARQYETGHFITTEIEHDSVLEPFSELEKQGYKVTYLKVDTYGRIHLKELEEAITKDTKMISVMTVNNEIGTIQEIKEISRIARKHGILFHTDAVQAMGQVDIDVSDVDLMTLSAHKIYGPKGCGALFCGKGVKLIPLIFGGHQESGKRSGTENVAGIIGFGEAAERIMKHKEESIRRQKQIGELLCREMEKIQGVHRNGHPDAIASHIYHFSVEELSTEAMLTMLHLSNIEISSGSACQAGSYRVSHVMKAIGQDVPMRKIGHLRVSIGKHTTEQEILLFTDKIKSVIAKQRSW